MSNILREKIARLLWSADQDSIETPFDNLMCGPVLDNLFDLADQLLDVPEIANAITCVETLRQAGIMPKLCSSIKVR